jgi:hypothetical protein
MLNQERTFLTTEVQRLVDCRTTYRSPNLPLISSPIHTILKKNGKFQLIINMRYLNSHLVVPKFKMEGLETLSKMLKPEDQMFTVDLQDGYYYISMHKTALSYMMFEWEGQYYVYCMISFGLAISPLVFSKMMKSVISHLRQLGHRILAYLDNFIELAKNTR